MEKNYKYELDHDAYNINIAIGRSLRDYTKDEIDQKLKEFVSDDVYTKNEIDNKFGDYYTKSEVDTLLSSVKVAIDENELNAMLAEVLI